VNVVGIFRWGMFVDDIVFGGESRKEIFVNKKGGESFRI